MSVPVEPHGEAVAALRNTVRLMDGGSRPMAKPVGTCGHCRLPIEDSDVVVIFEDGRLIHVGCWRVSDSAMSRQSSGLVRRSWKLIDDFSASGLAHEYRRIETLDRTKARNSNPAKKPGVVSFSRPHIRSGRAPRQERAP